MSAGEQALGLGRSPVSECFPAGAECQVRYGGDGMRRNGRGLDGWNDDLGRMMRRFRNREGSKRGGEIRHPAGGRIPRTNRFT